MQRTAALLLGALALAVGLAGLPASAQQWIGTYNDWNVFQRNEGARVCYMSSTPIDMEPKSVRRSDVYVRVTHGAQGRDTVEIIPGYGLDAQGTAVVTVDATEFRLRSIGTGAVPTDAAQDAALVKAMMVGSRMAVRVNSGRGSATVDTYSLTGFTAAHGSMSASCRA